MRENLHRFIHALAWTSDATVFSYLFIFLNARVKYIFAIIYRVFFSNLCSSKSSVTHSNNRGGSKLRKETNDVMGKKIQRKKIIQNIADTEKYGTVLIYAADNEHENYVTINKGELTYS